MEVQRFTSKPICNFSAAKLLLFNSRSVINKWREICFAIDYYNADIVAVTETWLSAESDSHAFSYRNYKKFSAYRNQRIGGGVMCLINSEYIVAELKKPESSPSSCETLILHIKQLVLHARLRIQEGFSICLNVY